MAKRITVRGMKNRATRLLKIDTYATLARALPKKPLELAAIPEIYTRNK